MAEFDDIRVILDLDRLGELIGAVAQKFTELRGLEPPDFDGEEMRELAVAGWHHVLHMSDRAEFAASVQKDLAQLEGIPLTMPKHQSEFGL